MNLELRRWRLESTLTIGGLYLDGEFFCFTLEDPVRPTKIQGETAIPEGTYDVILSRSPRFQRFMPEILGVPGFEGIRIHVGNTPEDTEGCILVGFATGREQIMESGAAFRALMNELPTTGARITIRTCQ